MHKGAAENKSKATAALRRSTSLMSWSIGSSAMLPVSCVGPRKLELFTHQGICGDMIIGCLSVSREEAILHEKENEGYEEKKVEGNDN